MPPVADLPSSRPLPSRALRVFSWTVLSYFIAVILLGALMRVTGSGGGCSDRWPLYNATMVQHVIPPGEAAEYIPRLLGAFSFLLTSTLLVWTWRTAGRRHLACISAAATVFFELVENALGSYLSLRVCTPQGQAPERPALLATHLANTMLMLAALTLTAHLLGRKQGYFRGQIRIVTPTGSTITLLAILAVGVTGLLAAQYMLGFLDAVLLTPTWLQVAHLFGATILWSALIVLIARVSIQPSK